MKTLIPTLARALFCTGVAAQQAVPDTQMRPNPLAN